MTTACRHCNGPLYARAGSTCKAGAKGYCGRCYQRWRDAGYPSSGPPDPRPPGDRAVAANALQRELRAARVEDFAELISWGVTEDQAARRVGVSQVTARRYLRELGVHVQDSERRSA